MLQIFSPYHVLNTLHVGSKQLVPQCYIGKWSLFFPRKLSMLYVKRFQNMSILNVVVLKYPLSSIGLKLSCIILMKLSVTYFIFVAFFSLCITLFH